jgi:Leucine-rich repeat (LRR) protein
LQLPGDLLSELPWEMRFLTNLQELRLSGNNFRYLPQCIFPAPSTDDDAGPGMTSLRILAIDHNPLLGIDEDMACCPLLQKLLVHNTKIRRLHKSIVYNRCLEEIWISDTAVRKLDTEVATLRQLKKIVLNHEDQLEGFTEIRRSIRGSVWCFLSEGEGMMAELSAVAKLEERIQRGRGKYKGKSLAAAIRTEAFGGKEVQELSMKDYQKSVLEKSRKAAAAKEDGGSQESSPADSPRGGPIIKFSKDTKGGESSDNGEDHAEESPDDGPITDGE